MVRLTNKRVFMNINDSNFNRIILQKIDINYGFVSYGSAMLTVEMTFFKTYRIL